MKVTGPFFDSTKRGQPKAWYLRVSMPSVDGAGMLKLQENGRPKLKRWRPYYPTKLAAIADISAIKAQHGISGTGVHGILTRDQVNEYDQAKRIAPGVPLPEIAQFCRRHHPLKAPAQVDELFGEFLRTVEKRLGLGYQHKDLKARVGAFVRKFSGRSPANIQRAEILTYLLNLDQSGRTIKNHKTSISSFFNWLVEEGYLPFSPAAGIKKKHLPRIERKEVTFLSRAVVEKYLRTAERYDPALVAHEAVQFFAGVRADDEMKNFLAEWVLPTTREMVIPAAAAKTGVREVINNLEANFWNWWRIYGPEKGPLRPKNYLSRWRRLRVLSSIDDRAAADRLASLSPGKLTTCSEASVALKHWPWNARRRTFCTYHVAKYQSADKTALILRHRGSSYTLHQSYRGLGVTSAEGRAYFSLMPQSIKQPMRPI